MTLTAALLVFLSFLGRAEEPVLKYSVNIGVSGASLVNDRVFLDGRTLFVNDSDAEEGTLEYLFENYYGKTFKTGQWSLRFSFFEDKAISVGVGLSGEAALRREYDSVNGKPLSYSSDKALSIYSRVKYNYHQKERVRFYSGVDLGLTVGNKKETWKVIPCFQIVPFGITYGKKAYLFGEIGLGCLYVGGSFGAGIRF